MSMCVVVSVKSYWETLPMMLSLQVMEVPLRLGGQKGEICEYALWRVAYMQYKVRCFSFFDSGVGLG